MKDTTWRRRLGTSLAVLATAVLASTASTALATIPHSSTGAITACHDSAGALRVIDAQAGSACAAGETRVEWNGTAITATRWVVGTVTQLPRGAGASTRVAAQPGAKRLSAGSWVITADVLIANSIDPPTSFRCYALQYSNQGFLGGQLQDWGGSGGWHRTLTISATVTLTSPDYVDIHCSHDQAVPSTGVFQVESVDVIAQRVVAVN
ncbi:hypothetical protein FHX81_7863 [Saccharothrix saharensis]|uniref:Secreted protein n=1 Tax=Saccharothrix saharensis TaxID=571190 RepID=A0A543JRA9_9PSEU|nr:hypothetical protein [Saccharothrix saharensis]TQM85383.1 hypothetical protein FHX81_7863 [Saccharothrix saharensis]